MDRSRREMSDTSLIAQRLPLLIALAHQCVSMRDKVKRMTLFFFLIKKSILTKKCLSASQKRNFPGHLLMHVGATSLFQTLSECRSMGRVPREIIGTLFDVSRLPLLIAHQCMSLQKKVKRMASFC